MVKTLIAFLDKDNKGWARWAGLHALPNIGHNIVLNVADTGLVDLGSVRSVMISNDFVAVQMEGMITESYIQQFGLINADDALMDMPDDAYKFMW